MGLHNSRRRGAGIARRNIVAAQARQAADRATAETAQTTAETAQDAAAAAQAEPGLITLDEHVQAKGRTGSHCLGAFPAWLGPEADPRCELCSERAGDHART